MINQCKYQAGKIYKEHDQFFIDIVIYKVERFFASYHHYTNKGTDNLNLLKFNQINQKPKVDLN